MKYIDYQSFKGSVCTTGGVIESMRIIRNHKYKKQLPLAVLNLNRISSDEIKVGIVKEDGTTFQEPSFIKWHSSGGLRIVQLVYRIRCGFGHYMMLIIEDSNLYLFNSSPIYADQVGLRRTLYKIAPTLNLKYKGTVFWKVGFLYRKQLQIQDTCSVWIALAYHIIASEPDIFWENLKTFLSRSKKEQRKILHKFHKDYLGGKSYSIPLIYSS
jgi:hypothetical protein